MAAEVTDIITIRGEDKMMKIVTDIADTQVHIDVTQRGHIIKDLSMAQKGKQINRIRRRLCSFSKAMQS